MKAVVLAAGEGSRMHPLTYTRPKVMLTVANKPILEHLLIEIREAGISDFIFVVGYHDEQVRDYFGNGDKWGAGISYSTQRRQLGTADALKAVAGLVDGNFLVVNGDIITGRKDIGQLCHKGDNAVGVVELKGDKISRIYEKVEGSASHMVNAGLYLFTPDIFDAISRTSKSPRGEYEITDSLQWMIDNGQPVSCQEFGYWLDLGYPWDLLSANESLLTGIEPQNLGEVEEGAVIKGAVGIGRGTIVRSGSYILGPVVIGQNGDIGPGCCIRPYTAIGDNCHLGTAVEVKNSIVMNGSKIPHHNYVGDSVIGEECNLGAGTKIANLRLDRQDITVGHVATKRHKLGAIIGDRVQTGINASINVGSMIGNDTFIGPGAMVSGVILPDSRLF